MSSRYPFPKFDLHLHLDGAIDPKTLMEMADERGVDHGCRTYEEFVELAICPEDCHSVNECLTRFELPTRILQDKASLARSAKELVIRSEAQDLTYIEIRFAPQLHTAKGLSQGDAVDAVIEGIAEGRKTATRIGVGLILCCMVIGGADLNREENIETVEVAKQYLGKGVDAIDLAGAEGISPFEDFWYIFDLADKYHLPRTCHAGDSHPAEAVRTAVFDYNSLRIGHGHHVAQDPELVRLCAEAGAFLEICLTSNIMCETEPSYEEHPAKRLLDAGLGVTLNTDNPVIFVTDIEKEYDKAIERCGFTMADLVRCNINSCRASFMPNKEKEPILRELIRWLDRYENA